jgi:hypothetical protein
MKKRILSICSLLIISSSLFSQIEVGANNNVGIGISGTVNSKLSINHAGSTGYTGYFYSLENKSGIYTKIGTPATSSSWLYGIYSDARQSQGNLIGIWGQSYSTTLRIGDSFGVFGSAGNGTNGRNYALYGRLEGSRNGAAVFGTTSSQITVPGRYAGYFYGTTEVNGTFYVKGVQVTSDMSAKKDVKLLEKNSLEKIKKVNAIKFKYKSAIELNQIEKATVDTLSIVALNEIEKMAAKEHIGLSAQEIQTIYPELISENPSGLLTIDYIGLIPILLEAIKEQQVTIETLVKEVDKLKIKK